MMTICLKSQRLASGFTVTKAGLMKNLLEL